MKKGYKALVDEATSEIKTYTVDQARAKLGEPGPPVAAKESKAKG